MLSINRNFKGRDRSLYNIMCKVHAHSPFNITQYVNNAALKA